MLKFLHAHKYYISGITLITLLTIVAISTRNDTPTWTTDTVSQGIVRSIISVSGSVDATQSAELSFPVGGILKDLYIAEGGTVIKGQTLAMLIHEDLLADAQDAQAALLIAESDLNELKNGIRPEEYEISKTNASIAKENLARITKEQNDRVANAYRTLLSDKLEARADKSDNNDTPPLIGGTYVCSEGSYTLSMFNSGARSGYSFHLSGIEQGTYTAYTETAAPLGDCGLTIKFFEGVTYGNSIWTIEIPNKQSA